MLILFVGSVIMIVFISINIFMTQNVSPLFSALIYEKREEAALSFLQAVQNEPFFESNRRYWQSVFDDHLSESIKKEKNKIQREIKTMEEILKKNPHSRDALTSLAILYLKQKDYSKAHNLYTKAKKIDPTVFISELE